MVEVSANPSCEKSLQFLHAWFASTTLLFLLLVFSITWNASLLRSYANEISVPKTSVTGSDMTWYPPGKQLNGDLANVKFMLKD